MSELRTVVVTGTECTGKTTLAAELAALFAAPWIPEAARLFAEQATEPLSAATVAPIARLAMRLEDEARAALPDASALLFRDTDLTSTVVYARHYYGAVEEWIAEEARTRRADLYLLCAPDLPWVADGIRDRPDRREELHADFSRTLDQLGAPVSVIRGTGEARTLAAVASVRAFLDRRTTATA